MYEGKDGRREAAREDGEREGWMDRQREGGREGGREGDSNMIRSIHRIPYDRNTPDMAQSTQNEVKERKGAAGGFHTPPRAAPIRWAP